MGACDFAMGPYTYDTVTGDSTLQHFSIEHDMQQMIPMMKRALAMSNNTLKIIGSPWSAPGWMKENGNEVCGIATCLFCRLKDEYYDSWALYFSKVSSADAPGSNVLREKLTLSQFPPLPPPFFFGLFFYCSCLFF